MRLVELFEAVFTTAPLKRISFGFNHFYSESDEPVNIYHRLTAAQMIGLLKKHHLRAVITPTDVYVADAGLAAHAGMRSVLKQYGIDTTDCINTIITGPGRMTYGFGKYYSMDDSQARKWREIREAVLNNPRIKIMFPGKLIFVRDDWT